MKEVREFGPWRISQYVIPDRDGHLVETYDVYLNTGKNVGALVASMVTAEEAFMTIQYICQEANEARQFLYVNFPTRTFICVECREDQHDNCKDCDCQHRVSK